MRVKNSNVNEMTGRTVTVFAKLNNGEFIGEKFFDHETGAKMYTHSIYEFQANINPTAGQLEKIIAALQSGELCRDELENVGSDHGGYSTINV